MNLVVETKENMPYEAQQMRDGEKVTLYFMAYVLQTPESGIVIIDEPEMYLHKAVLKKLWNILEKIKQECRFIYLTHNLKFAASRLNAEKLWGKSFAYPSNWEIESVPRNNKLPEPLFLELLGSRQNILFCEGKDGSIDEKIYNALFPNFTIKAVESCSSVINCTQAFGKMPQLTTIKAFGLIDSDYREPDELEELRKNNIFSCEMTEIENLFLMSLF